MPSKILQKIFLESGHDFSSDICPKATINDLDKNAINNFRKRWADKSGNKRIKTLSIKQLLTDCEVMVENKITYAALILFGTRAALGKYLSQCESIFEYRSSNAAGPAQQREEFRIGFFSFYDKIWKLINLRNDKQHYQDGFFVLDIPTFNERVVREAILNAVSHRNYQTSGSIFVKQYRDRLVIDNPGGFPQGITTENILTRQFPRNRLIATVLSLSGLVERAVQGMNLMYELSVKDAKPLPDFSGSDDYFVTLTLNGVMTNKRIPVLFKNLDEEKLELLSTNDYLLIDAIFNNKKIPKELKTRIKELKEIGVLNQEDIGTNTVQMRKNGGIKSELSESAKTALAIITKKPTITTDGLALELGKTPASADKILRELKKKGRIRRAGSKKSGYWEVL